MITVTRVEPDDADAHLLWEEQRVDLARRYSSPDLVLETTFPTLVTSLVGHADGEPVASIVARWSPYPTGAGSVELKRLWVRETHRGAGYAKVMMGAAEAAARRAGATRLVLETGTEQPEAIALYERLGWTRIASYGEYKDDPDSVCFALELPTRVLVVTGAMGAGKTTVAEAVHSTLALRGARTVMVDADALCEAYPSPPDDMVNQELLMECLAALAPVHRRHGFGLLVLPRILEDVAERDALSRALAGLGGPAEVSVVRITAPVEERVARLRDRETSSRWLEWAVPRTAEQGEELAALALEDAVVVNSGRAPEDAAVEALDAVGW